MSNKKLGFDEFISSVDKDYAEFVTELHQDLIKAGCTIEVKEAKSGYVVSYLLKKKTIANYVFRKKGLIIRLYANNISQYTDFLNTLPANMVKSIESAPVCKRLINPEDCNPKCAMGYDFTLNDKHFQKCRYNAFMFLLSEENNPYIKAFLQHELEACS